MTRAAPRSIDAYLRELKAALAGADPALIQDALYDAEEYLRGEVASHPDKTEGDVLELIASTYGAPQEVAEAYRTTEKQVAAALATPRPKDKRTALGRFFSVYGDSRAWTAVFYMLLSMATGVFYFTCAVTGLSMSAGFAVLIIGVPFFLLFVAFTRILSLAEGRLVEGLLGVRMPRRPRYPSQGRSFGARIADMLKDRRTWTTLLYLIAMLPLGVLYFTLAIVGVCVGLALTTTPVFEALHLAGLADVGISFGPGYGFDSSVTGPLALVMGLMGIVWLTGFMHLARGVGQLHGQLAKALLVSRDGE
jgi:uncharacterized membrane protein